LLPVKILRPGVLLKASISALLLADVCRRVQWQEMSAAIRAIDLGWLALYLVIGCVGLVVSAAKWHLLARCLGVRASLPQLLSLYMVGYLFNQVLPTNVGGDAIRAYELGKSSGRTQPPAIASVFMERVTGFAVLVVLVLAGVAFDGRAVRDPAVVIGVVAAIGAYAALVTLVLLPSLFELLVRRVPASVARRLVKGIREFQHAMHGFRREPAALLGALAYSVLFYAVTIVTVYVGCLAFDVRVSVFALTVAVPVVLTVSAVPISLGGFGLQEWAYAQGLGAVGVPTAVGLGLALLARARALLFGLIGAVSYPLLTRSAGSREAAAPAAAARPASPQRPVAR